MEPTRAPLLEAVFQLKRPSVVKHHAWLRVAAGSGKRSPAAFGECSSRTNSPFSLGAYLPWAVG